MYTNSTYKLGATLNVPEETKTYLVTRMKIKQLYLTVGTVIKPNRKSLKEAKSISLTQKKSADFSSMAWKFE